MQAQCDDFNIFLPSDCSVPCTPAMRWTTSTFFTFGLLRAFALPQSYPQFGYRLASPCFYPHYGAGHEVMLSPLCKHSAAAWLMTLVKKNLQFFKNWKIREDGISRVTTSVRFCLTTAALPGACNTSRCKGRSLHDLTSRLSHPTPKPSSIFLHLFLSACRNFSVKCTENVLSSSLCLLIWLTYFQYMKS